jgi:hypothetical protein
VEKTEYKYTVSMDINLLRCTLISSLQLCAQEGSINFLHILDYTMCNIYFFHSKYLTPKSILFYFIALFGKYCKSSRTMVTSTSSRILLNTTLIQSRIRTVQYSYSSVYFIEPRQIQIPNIFEEIRVIFRSEFRF